MERFNRSRGWLITAALVGALALSAACSRSDDSDSASRGDDGAPSVLGGQSSTDEFKGADGDAAETGQTFGEPIAGGAVAPNDTSAGGAASQQLLDRKLIRTATIQIETDAVSQKFEDISNIAVSSGGLVFSSQFGNDGERQTASITIRVPNERYEEVLNQLRRLGDVRSENSNATDVTEEFTDLQSNLTNLQATEREYLKLLTQAGTIDEILVVQDRINVTRSQIDQIQGRLNLIGNQTDLATITAHLTPVLAQPPTEDKSSVGIGEFAENAFESSLAVLFGIAVVLIAIGAFSWWLLPLAAAGIYLGRRQMKQDRTRNQTPPPTAT